MQSKCAIEEWQINLRNLNNPFHFKAFEYQSEKIRQFHFYIHDIQFEAFKAIIES